MTTDAGDIVLDPTCGSGTTAYVAEQWGRRWMTIDTSRVPLALARQRLLTATFPYYELKEEAHGPAKGFAYKRSQKRNGEEDGGIVPRVTLSSIANGEPADDVVLVDRPEVVRGVTRVTGPFVFEATIPTPLDWEAEPPKADDAIITTDRMLEVLRRSPVLRLPGNETVTFRNIRQPVRTMALSAEAFVEASAPGQQPTLHEVADEAEEKNGSRLASVAFVFGPEDGAVSERLVQEAGKEAYIKSYTHLYVIGFAVQPNARMLIENSAAVMGIPATYVQASTDLMMGDLLKHMRSSQIFSVCGLPEIKLHPMKDGLFSVELLGLDVFDPASMEVDHRRGDDVPAWFLDTDYNNLCFHVNQAFFPRTAAWEQLEKSPENGVRPRRVGASCGNNKRAIPGRRSSANRRESHR